MDEAKTPPGFPGDRSQAAAEKLRALRERANQALDDHRRRLADLESQLNDRVHQLAEEFSGDSLPPADAPAPVRADDAEVADLRRQLEEGRAKHEKFVEQLAAARRQLDALQSQACPSCQKAADSLAAAETDAQRLRQELDEAKRLHQEEKVRHDRFAEQLAQARQALSELQHASGDRAAELHAELESARKTKGELQTELDAARAAKAEIETELTAARAAEDDLEARLAAASRDLDILHVECDGATALARQLEQEGAAGKAQREALEARVAELETKRAADVAEIDRLKSLNAHGAEDIRQSQSAESSLRAQLSALEESLSKVQTERDGLGRKVSELETTSSSLDAALAHLKSAGEAEQLRLTELHAAAQREAESLGTKLAAGVAEKQAVDRSLAESQAGQQELRASLESATQELARAQEKVVAAAALQVELDQARVEIDGLRVAASSQQELEQLQQKFDLALADVQKLKRETAGLREELSRRPEANDQESPELIAVRLERDALILRIGELEAAAAKADDREAQQAREDLQRRFEMAVDDVRQLKQENSQLRDKLATASKASAGAAVAGGSAAGGPLDWAAQRARLMALLEEEETDGPVSGDRKKERATIESTIATTDNAVADLEQEIAELRAELAGAGTAAERDDGQARARAELLDADETIAAERGRIAQLETQWEDKMRAAELEIAVERARLAREQAALKERMLELELGLPQATGADDGGAKPRRKWLSALGLGDDADEPKKKK